MTNLARRERRLGTAIAAVLLADACCHLYWATGATWPAADELSLSVAVLGFGVDFRPGLLLGLALMLSTGAGLVLARAFLGRSHQLGLLWQAGTAAVTAGTLIRGMLGLIWIVPAAGYVSPGFYWTNLVAYTPLCLGMAAAGLRLLRPARTPTGWRRLLTARAAVVALPVGLVAALVSGAYGLSPQVQDYAPHQGLGAIESLSATHTVYAVDLPGQGFTTLHDEGFAFDLDCPARVSTRMAGFLRGD